MPARVSHAGDGSKGEAWPDAYPNDGRTRNATNEVFAVEADIHENIVVLTGFACGVY